MYDSYSIFQLKIALFLKKGPSENSGKAPSILAILLYVEFCEIK